MHRVIAIFAVLLLTACGSAPEKEQIADNAEIMGGVKQRGAESLGSIYMPSRGLSLFLDRRARQVGDSITVTLLEQTDASKQSSTSTAKEQSNSIPGVTLFGRGVTKDGIPILETSIEADQEFAGQGSSSQSNSLKGSVTVTVAEVLPNGNLLVRGEKWVTINQGEEFIRVTGVVRPEDIGADNSVPSFKLADARITYSGKGAIADANRMGWLGRFFQSVLSPF
ncbi:flagellar L-ring protein precursor FlgH [Litorivivens lipolytica]|uniref:Flagellar L-ring protein n=1 Tax=Litorivivens lipolytica TaxID=1524264 RepID=A0A7W4W304_9GAMM|nr:flagellar basal body L-ring protein FlgH [Litorivivens lipolytica]MBB3046380.1 flagellar L-ring protein precursor FlgH [Litorivivens lipolytica]